LHATFTLLSTDQLVTEINGGLLSLLLVADTNLVTTVRLI